MFCSRCGTWAPESASACAACGAPLDPGQAAAGMAHAAQPAGPHAPTPAPLVAPGTARLTARWPRDTFGGFWRRFAAAFVDGVVLFFPQSIVRVLLGLPLFSSHDASDSGTELLVSVGSLFMYWLYSALFESSARQATLGQQVLGLQVMDLDGRRVSFARATGRYFAQLLSVLLCGVGYLFNLWTSRRQTLHDLVAGCVLVRADRVPHAAPAQAGELV